MANENNPSMKRINQFHDDHQWRQFHNAKDLALSVSIEAAELLEIFQWTDPESAVEKKREDIEEELADVLIYCYTLAEKLDMDIDEIIAKKLVKNLKKYPVQLIDMQKEIPLVLAGFLFFVRFYSQNYQNYAIDSALKNE